MPLNRRLAQYGSDKDDGVRGLMGRITAAQTLGIRWPAMGTGTGAVLPPAWMDYRGSIDMGSGLGGGQLKDGQGQEVPGKHGGHGSHGVGCGDDGGGRWIK